MRHSTTYDRRRFLGTAGCVFSAAALQATLASLGRSPTGGATRPRVGVIMTEMRHPDHAYLILENFLARYLFRGVLTDPGCDVVSFYCEQFPTTDCAREVAQRYKIPLFRTIDEALCLGGKELAVDAVLAIGEHGAYAKTKHGVAMYPRKRFFDESVRVMRRSGRVVPYFNDKHLSYRWDWAREMFDTARELAMPMAAGSSVPWAQRIPPLALDGAEIEEAVSVHAGPLEAYGIHALEVLQSFVERRRGGESGIRRIEAVTGDAVLTAEKAGRWSRSLLDAAMQAESAMGVRRSPSQVRPMPQPPYVVEHAILVDYEDGLRAAVLKVGADDKRWNFACKLQGDDEPRATSIYGGPWGNRNLFKALAHLIQTLFIERREPFPLERCLLTTGAVEAAVRSHAAGKPLDTPHLKIPYRPADDEHLREDGKTWEKLTADIEPYVPFEAGDEHWMRAAK